MSQMSTSASTATEATIAAATNSPLGYDPFSVRLHWITAGLVVLLWGLAKTIDWFAIGAPRVDARSAHIVLGAALAAVLVLRIVWRLQWGRRLPAANEGIAGAAARLVHIALYALLLSVVGLGIANAWIRGDDLFNLFSIPSIAPGNKALRHSVGHLHSTFANILLILAGLHALAGLAHHYVLKDGVLRRMSAKRSH